MRPLIRLGGGLAAAGLLTALSACGGGSSAGTAAPSQVMSSDISPAAPTSPAISSPPALPDVGENCAAMDSAVTRESQTSASKSVSLNAGDFHFSRVGTLASVDYGTDVSQADRCISQQDTPEHRAPDGSTLRFADFAYHSVIAGARSGFYIQDADEPTGWFRFSSCANLATPRCDVATNPSRSTVFASLRPGQQIILAEGGAPAPGTSCSPAASVKAWNLDLFEGTATPLANMPKGLATSVCG